MKLKRKWIIALLVIASILTGCAKKEDPVEVQYENLHEKVSETMELEGNFSVTMNVYIDEGSPMSYYDPYSEFEFYLGYNGNVLHIPLFRNTPYIEKKDGSIVEYEQQEGKWYSSVSKPAAERDVTIQLYRSGSLIEGKASFKTALETIDFWEFYIVLDEEVETFTLQYTAAYLTLEDMVITQANNGFLLKYQDSWIMFFVVLAVCIGLAFLGYIVSLHMGTPVSFDNWIGVNMVVTLLTFYGLLGVLHKFFPQMIDTILGYINGVFATVGPTISFNTGLLANINGFMPYVALGIAFVALCLLYYDFEYVSDVFMMYVSGLMCLPCVYFGICTILKIIYLRL